jgi:hydroxyacylglutathione hydrolase
MFLGHYMLDVGPLESNSYLVGNENTQEGFLVDAGKFDPLIVEQASSMGLKMRHVLLTHHHWDHVDGLDEFIDAWPGICVLTPAPIQCATENVKLLKPGQAATAGGFKFKVFRTSGHTAESVSFYFPELKICFVGDAIFAGAVGGTNDDTHFNEEVGCLRDSIMQLPDETELLSGHGPATSVAIEKKANPFLQPGFGRTA